MPKSVYQMPAAVHVAHFQVSTCPSWVVVVPAWGGVGGGGVGGCFPTGACGCSPSGASVPPVSVVPGGVWAVVTAAAQNRCPHAGWGQRALAIMINFQNVCGGHKFHSVFTLLRVGGDRCPERDAGPLKHLLFCGCFAIPI